LLEIEPSFNAARVAQFNSVLCRFCSYLWSPNCIPRASNVGLDCQHGKMTEVKNQPSVKQRLGPNICCWIAERLLIAGWNQTALSIK
jgi:hypothetical protein